MIKKKYSQAFALPTVLILSLTVLTILLALLATISAAHKGIYVDHYQALADEAAEAGTAYAASCLNISNHVQTWGAAMSKPDLAQTTDCAGTANAYPSNTYVYSDSTVRTYFLVGDLDYSLSYTSQISSRGYAEVLKPDGTVSKTYTSIQKMTLTWSTDYIGSMSASGTNRTCAVVSGSVYCWGFNAYGQLGNGQYIGSGDIEAASSVDSLVPVKVVQQAGVMAGKTIVKIFVAQYHSCALSSDGKVYCWGYNANGQLGNGTQTDSAVPVQVGGALSSLTVTDIGGTKNTSCAIASGKIYCWGNGGNGLTGSGASPATVTTPTLVSATGTATTLSASYTATILSTSGSRSGTMCAVADGFAYCWGTNDVGQIGDGTTTTPRQLPTKVVSTGVLSGKTITSISQDGYPSVASGGYPHVCAVASGALYCWGENNDGQLGDSTTTDRSSPVAVTASGVLSGHTVQDVKAGLRHTCALADGAVYCWGFNSSGQVGDTTNTTRTAPVTVTQTPGELTSSNVISIGAGANRSCAVINDGRTFCWGLNNNGQIGDGTTTSRNNPTESLFLRPVANKYIF